MPSGARSRLATLLLTAALPATAADPARLDAIVVVANRRPEPADQVAAPVSRIEREDIEGLVMQQTGDLARFVPGLAMEEDTSRFGPGGFSLRGLGGNRLRVELDGVPLPETFSVGQFASASRDLADLELLERMEVLRGPASTLYGSDALAGIIALYSLDPESVLARRPDRDAVTSLRLGTSQRDHALLRSASHARRLGENAGLLLAASRRDGEETQNLGEGPFGDPNPADTRREAALAKLSGHSDRFGEYTLTAEGSRGERQTDVVSQRFGPGRFATTTSLLGDDRYRRNRVSLATRWSLGDPLGHELALLAYGQDSEVTQDTAQTRNPDRTTPYPSLRERRFRFRQESQGLDLVASAAFRTAETTHSLLYGIELERQRYSGLRDGAETNLLSGERRAVILGERFPVRDFPTSVAKRLGVFAQDEWRFGRWSLIPGLRWERYRLDARPDAIFREDFPDLAVVDDRATGLTGKLGLRYAITAHQQLFLQYAEGFRSPPFSDLNIGLLLPALNYEVRPNPELRDERSRGLDLGWRWSGDAGALSLTLFHNRYRDLIESRANLGVDPATGALVFQSVNRQRARIEGVELEGSSELSRRWRLRFAAAWARGDDTERDRPLNGIEPGRIALGLAYGPDSGTWGGELLARTSARKQRIDHGSGVLFAPPGFAALDLATWWQPHPAARIHLAIENLFDRKYWTWASVRGVPADARDLERYTQPGRTLSLRLALDL